ncbi:ABC transporter substrate-binding protein [Paralcaligenes ureilyticus]|uniref:Amino acid ABC transporter substrate-binding protein (PAAT family) n=1 Tax=Paralcaligenes ureilyticus TaxID=627131 RepID=A0A4R3M0T8_9BURK|nr:ABC transporter substrate-binding protein [Paralcaligenes ureilyticus]TCT06333.1 amino acid ABC transporter substrate-binding protein (PAAT family) [Paralcaligenes ureilyticus]
MLTKKLFTSVATVSLSLGCLAFQSVYAADAPANGAQTTEFLTTDFLSTLKPDQGAIKALPEKIRNKKVLTIGGETTLAPYLFRQDGKITGIEADFMQALEKVLDVKINVINTGFSSMIIGLLSGRVDVAMSDFSDTVAREEQVDFVDYTKTGQMLVVAKGNPLKIHSLADLCGHIAAGPTGSLSVQLAEQQSATCLTEGKKAVDVKKYPSGADTYLALGNGRVDTSGIDYAIAAHQVKASNGKLELAGELFAKGFHGAALPKDNPQLRDALLKAFQSIYEQGAAEKILAKWGVSQMLMTGPGINATAAQK